MFRLNRLFLMLFVVLTGKILSAQQPLADSIRQLLAKELPDSARAYNMVMLAMYTEPVDPVKAHELYRETVDFSLKRGLDYYAGLALFYEATPFYVSGKYPEQRANLLRSVDLLEKSDHHNAKAQLGAVFGGLSGYYRVVEKFDSAVIASLHSIRILEDLKKYRSLTINCLNLAMIYQQLKLPEKQKEYVDKGVKFARMSGNRDMIMISFLQKAGYLTEIKDFEGAKACADSATPYFSDKYDFSRKQNFFLLKAGTFQNVKAYDSAVVYFRKSHDLAKVHNSRWNMTEPLLQIGYVYLQQKKYKEAEKYIQMGLEIAEKDSIKTFIKVGFGTLSDIYAATGRYEEAFHLLGKYNDLKDTLQSEERKKFALDLEKKYETEKNAGQIRQLEAEKRIQELSLREKILIIQTLAGIVLTLLIVGFLLLRNYRQKQKLQEQKIGKLEAEKMLAATEAVLKGEEQERSRLAKDLHDGLGGLLSGIKFSFQNMKENLILTPENARVFERSLDMLDSSIHEMRRVAHNLMPETLLKFGLETSLRDFCGSIHQTGVLQANYQSYGFENYTPEQTLSVNVYRIVQELVNNTLKHAEARTLLVQLTKSDNLLLVDVEDDGRGFDPELLRAPEGMGWRNTMGRVKYLNGKIDVQTAPGKGTSIHLEIPLV